MSPTATKAYGKACQDSSGPILRPATQPTSLPRCSIPGSSSCSLSRNISAPLGSKKLGRPFSKNRLRKPSAPPHKPSAFSPISWKENILLTLETKKVWDAIRQIDNLLKGFVLIGGTALALHIQHRLSEDLDFACVGAKLPRERILSRSREDIAPGI